MKSSGNTNTRQSKQGMSKKPGPEIRDDMDSRHQKISPEKKNSSAVGKEKNL